MRDDRYKKYNNYEKAWREFRASMSDAYLETETTPLLLYDPVGHDVSGPMFAPANHHGKDGWWKVLITTVVVLVVGIWMGRRRGNNEYPS